VHHHHWLGWKGNAVYHYSWMKEKRHLSSTFDEKETLCTLTIGWGKIICIIIFLWKKNIVYHHLWVKENTVLSFFLYAHIWKWGHVMLYHCRPSVPLALSSQLLLNQLRDCDETWYKGRSQRGDVPVIRWALSNHFYGYAPALKRWAYYAILLSSTCPINFVFATPPKPIWGF
jgi:hypothetical protein